MGSKILKIYVNNFMSISEAELSFDDKGIINIKGYNDSGKSAIIRALEVCFNNYKPSKQAKFIKDGEKCFIIKVSFTDGVEIVRHKYRSGQSLYEMYKNGEEVYTSKVNGVLTKVDAVPDVIKSYLGLSELGNGVLNFRRITDKLFLSQTTGRENFEDLNQLFGIDELVMSINLVKQDIADTNNKIGTNDQEMTFVKAEIDKSELLSEETLSKLKEREEYSSGLENCKGNYEGIISTITSLDEVIVPESGKLDLVSDNASLLLEIMDLAEWLSQPQKPRITGFSDFVGTDALTEVTSLCGAILGLRRGVKLDKVSSCDVGLLEQVLGEAENVSDSSVKLNSAISKVQNIKDILNTEISRAKSTGISFHKCDNCGSYSVISD